MCKLLELACADRLFGLFVAEPFAVEYLAVDFEECSVALAVAFAVFAVPEVAVCPIVYSVAVAASVAYLAVV